MTTEGTPDVAWRVLRILTEHPRDDEGRPLHEGRTPEAHLAAGDIEYKQCPYAGSRYLVKPMNASALRQASAHWGEILDALAFVRRQYTSARGIYGPDIMDVWRVSQLGCALPWFYILRGETAPAYAAALAKVSLGTAVLSQQLLSDALARQWAPPPFTGESLLALTESTGTLVGETEVCAAPDRMIRRFLEVLVEGDPNMLGIGAVASLHADHEAVLRFGSHYASLKLLLWVHFLARRFLYADVIAAHPDALARFPLLRELVDAPCDPPELFIVEPPDLAKVSRDGRAEWFGALAQLVVPLALDGSDRPLHDLAQGIASAMSQGLRPAATFALLDANLGHILGVVERGLGGSVAGPVDAATRDRMFATSPRALFDQLS